MALIFPVAALVNPFITWAASGNVQVCQPSSSCQVGEFLFDDSYVPITSATCTITARNPDGTVLLNASAMTASAQGDGWYYKDVSTPATTGLYRTQVCCTAGSDYLCLDKSFEVQDAASGGGASAGAIATAVWNTDRSSHTTSGTFGAALQNVVPTTSAIASSTWDYSSRSLSTFGDLVSNVWSYSSSSNSDIGDLIANIWKHDSRTLSDSSVTTNNTTTINNINSAVRENNDLLELLLNKPTIESSLENGSDDYKLEAKIDDTKKAADSLNAKVKYIRSKARLLDSKWGELTKDQISKSVADISYQIGSKNDLTDKSSILGATAWTFEQWNWQEASAVEAQAKALQSRLKVFQNEIDKKGKSAAAKKELKTIIVSADKIQALVGNNSSSSKNKTVFNRINEVVRVAKAYDSKTLELSKLYALVSQGQQGAYDLQTDQLSKDISVLNSIPKIQKNILAKAETGDKGMKNKILSLLGMVDANRMFLAKKPEDTLASTWLELGSIVFKTLISNPSEKISQEVPLKYYLPAEIKRENILEIDDSLSVNFDAEKNQYYAAGTFELEPGESKTLSIKVDDAIFAFNKEEIEGIKKQAAELSEPLKNTSYFAQGATLKSDIDVSLNRVLSLQGSANTPEEKIRAYREGKILMEATAEKMDKLKEIATSAGSVNTLFGFVGGAQVMAVWGMVIILITGFVFLALYFKMIKNNESRGQVLSVKGKAKKGKVGFDEEFEAEERKSKGHRGFRLAAVVLISVVGVGLAGGFGLMQIRNSQATNGQTAQAKPQTGEIVLGEATASGELKPDLKGEEVKLFVPFDSSVSVHKEPSIDSEVLVNLELSQTVEKVGSQDSWVKVVLDQGASGKVTGWVDADFIEVKVVEQAALTPIESIIEATEAKKTTPSVLKLVTVSETPTGFLRVRSGPGGKELGKLDPGKKYPVMDSKSGWLNILMDDGTLGWVSSKYTDFNGKKATGGQNETQE